MKITEEREAWIHTHFFVDGLLTPEQQRTLSMQVEPEIHRLGIQYGVHYMKSVDQERSIVVLECIPLEPLRKQIRHLIERQLEQFTRPAAQPRNVVTHIRVEEAEETSEPSAPPASQSS